MYVLIFQKVVIICNNCLGKGIVYLIYDYTDIMKCLGVLAYTYATPLSAHSVQ